MPGPQLTNAVPLARAVKARYPDLPIVWGGNFPSLYPLPVLNALNPTEFAAEVDLAGLLPGTYTLPVRMRVPEGVTADAVQPESVTVTITQR